MVLSGDLTFEEESTSLVYEVPHDTQCDSHTWSRVMKITGKLWDACKNAQEMSVYVLHAVHTFHDETWDLFTFVGGANDHYGDLNSLISSSRKKAGGDFTVIHCSGATSNWQPQIDPAMLHFRLQLVNRHGARLRSARPFNQDDYFVRVHEQAALVFTAEKKQLFVLCAIIGCGSMKSGIPKYWRFTDAVGTEHDAADQGIPLTNEGRWRSLSTLSYLQQEGLGTVPADIQDEIAELVDNLPSKRDDESQRSSSTWRRKFHASAPESEPPAHRRPGYPPTTYDQQPTGATASSSGTKPPPPSPPPAPKRSNPTTGEAQPINKWGNGPAILEMP